MSSRLLLHEGSVPFRGQRTWYGVAGDHEAPDKLPLLVVHGGPGAPHDYLEPLADLAHDGRRVVFYDQIGCGASGHLHDPALWTVETFVAELLAVREALGLAACHILGQSWGGLLVLEAALAGATGVAGLILADPLVSTSRWVAEADRLRAALPPDVQAVLVRHEAAGTTDSPEYEAAMLVYYARHVCRLDPWPECLRRSFAKVAEAPEVYATMWGPSEFHCTGTLRDWDVRPRLGGLGVPALVLGGRHDECTPAIQGDLADRLPRSEWVVFEHSSHMPHLEEPEAFRAAVLGFLERVESGIS